MKWWNGRYKVAQKGGRERAAVGAPPPAIMIIWPLPPPPIPIPIPVSMPPKPIMAPMGPIPIPVRGRRGRGENHATALSVTTNPTVCFSTKASRS